MRKAFTIIELLVVIGIIAVLASILLPVLSSARGQSNRVACRAQLRDIGASFAMYMSDSKGKLPDVNPMPSVKPPINSAPSLPVLLQPYIRSATKVLRCPSDQISKPADGVPPGFDTYYEREGSSYQYNPFLVPYAGKKVSEIPIRKIGHPELHTIIDEYEPFHGKPGAPGSMNHLFGDLHVGSVGQ